MKCKRTPRSGAKDEGKLLDPFWWAPCTHCVGASYRLICSAILKFIHVVDANSGQHIEFARSARFRELTRSELLHKLDDPVCESRMIRLYRSSPQNVDSTPLEGPVRDVVPRVVLRFAGYLEHLQSP